MAKYIGIWYSWGESEYPVEVPECEDAFKYMMKIALEEVRVSVVEGEYAVTIFLEEDEDGGKVVVLNYHSDNEYCFYKIFDSEEECLTFLDEHTNDAKNYGSN